MGDAVIMRPGGLSWQADFCTSSPMADAPMKAAQCIRYRGAGRNTCIELNRPPHSRALLLVIAYLGFISLGLPDTLIGVAWPSVRDAFHLPQGAVALLFVGTSASYFFSSFFTGKLLGVWGIGLLLAGSSGLVAASGLGYALAPAWGLFALCSLLHGLGSGAIDAGLNHYVSQHFPARHMTWLHACYGVGAMLGPLIMTGMIAGTGSWRNGYLTVGLSLLALTVLFALTRRKWEAHGATTTAVEQVPTAKAGTWEALRHPIVALQAVIFFVYTGLEVTLGQWSFTLLTESRSVSRETAGMWVTLYWSSLMAGRILCGFIVERMGIDRLLRGSMLVAMAGTALFAWNPGTWSSSVGLAITGLSLAAIYPCLMTRTPQRLGKALAAHAIGFQVSTAMLGAAALPSLSGFVAQRSGLETVAVATVVMAAVVWALHEWLLRLGAKGGEGDPASRLNQTG